MAKDYEGQRIILTRKADGVFTWAGYIGMNCLFLEQIKREKLLAMGFGLAQLPTAENPRRHFRMVEI